VTPRLLRAFRATSYRADGAVLSIGQSSPSADALLTAMHRREAALITAWNPFGRRKPAGFNHRMMRALRARLRLVPYRAGSGEGRGWREELLFAAIHPARARRLARQFRQLGIVTIRRRGRAELLLLRWG
jgi:Protein of unknown function (DUF3293)